MLSREPGRGGRAELGACLSQEPLTDPAQQAWLEGSLHRGCALRTHGWVARLCAASSGLQRAKMPAGALPGSAATGQPQPGLCPATWYGSSATQTACPRRQAARDSHVPWEHRRARVQALPLPRAPSTGGQQRFGKNRSDPWDGQSRLCPQCCARSQMCCHPTPCTPEHRR